MVGVEVARVACLVVWEVLVVALEVVERVEE